ncbi:hypothetical protein EXE30_04055 [Acinetobacter halotolerans]|uniref:Uncharacterized protein n=1 Tax=Acinetobacter halotolerans TaxID=1752076 RepID=A0A4Q6XLF8_9GAMM|nr:hypothetical protein [Acinetobacter halotolerans]RZF55980.1 hypothetical protein EXE30_04055 [Acinetobacter halotolerans]
MFQFNLMSDTSLGSGVLEAKQHITTTQFYRLIESENYGSDLNGIAIVLMCREENSMFKQRLRFSKKEKVLYMDIMLDYDKFSILSHKQRISEICRVLLTEIPLIVKKYKFKDFDLDLFINKLNYWFESNNYIEE